MTLERIPLIWTSSIQFSEKVIFLSFKSSKVKIQLLWDINPILSCFFWSITWYRIWDVMSLFLYLFFIPNKRSVGITHTKYYRTLFILLILRWYFCGSLHMLLFPLGVCLVNLALCIQVYDLIRIRLPWHRLVLLVF